MAVAEDFKDARISNRLIACGLIWGLAFRVIGEGSLGVVCYLVNISIPVVLLFLLFQMRALGAGDIKLFSVAGGFLSTGELMRLILVAILVAGIIGAGKLLWIKKELKIWGKERTLMHFSSAIIFGYFFVVLGVFD